jgi:uncharacterized protein (DUF2384 family)
VTRRVATMLVEMMRKKRRKRRRKRKNRKISSQNSKKVCRNPRFLRSAVDFVARY